MSELPSHYDPEQAPNPEVIERHILARAIATRHLKDQMAFIDTASRQLDIILPEPPDFFVDAITDAYATGIEVALKTPTPYAYIFDCVSSIPDNLSTGDLVTLAQEENIEHTPNQIRLFTKAAIIATEGTSPRPPEGQFENFMKMTRQANIIASERGIHPGTVYEDDELYAELIRRSISREDYETGFLDGLCTLTPDNILTTIIRVKQLMSQVINNPDVVMQQGFKIDEQELQKKKREIEADPDAMKEVSDYAQKAAEVGLGYLMDRIQQFWGNTVSTAA